jgi:tetratricopeptide (TPR) repeat protein
MKTPASSLIVILIAGFCLLPGGALAAGGGAGDTVSVPRDPAIARAQEAIAAKDWTRAAAVMREALAGHPDNADYHNLYAYALRKGPNPDMKEVFRHYEEALRIDPGHRNAHEYIGEAYLQVGNLAKAKGHLAALDKLCWLPCEQYTELKEAVEDYEAKHR